MTNKDVVRAFTRIVFNGRDLSQLERFMREDYIQHSYGIESGREAFRDFAENRFFAEHPGLELKIMNLFEDGDLVFSHNHAVLEEGVNEAVVFDIYRLQDGKLAEHWDCIQPLKPEQMNPENIKRIFDFNRRP